MNDTTKNSRPDIAEPTEEEIRQAVKMVKDKYDTVIPKSDIIKFTGLINELNWWLNLDEKPNSPRRITEEMAMSYKELTKKTYDEDITLDEAYNKARGLLMVVPMTEKRRISQEIRAIIVTHRPVPFEPIVQEKVSKLFQLHYGAAPTDSQLEQVVPYLTKKMWYEVGLDVSLEECLDDLLIYADKRKRGKQTKSVELHDKLRQALDLVANDLKLAEKDFDPLYRG